MRISALFAMAATAANALDVLDVDSQLVQEDITKAALNDAMLTQFDDVVKDDSLVEVDAGRGWERQSIISASQNDCGHLCRRIGGPLKTLTRRPDNHHERGRSCTHSNSRKAGNWVTIGIP